MSGGNPDGYSNRKDRIYGVGSSRGIASVTPLRERTVGFGVIHPRRMYGYGYPQASGLTMKVIRPKKLIKEAVPPIELKLHRTSRPSENLSSPIQPGLLPRDEHDF